jgi:hypothetical protein
MAPNDAQSNQNTNTHIRSTMINQRELTLLEQLEAAGCGVDVDAGDPEVAKALPFKPHDMTSNQILVHERIMAPENKELVEKTIREMKGADWLDVHIKLVSLGVPRSWAVMADMSDRSIPRPCHPLYPGPSPGPGVAPKCQRQAEDHRARAKVPRRVQRRGSLQVSCNV